MDLYNDIYSIFVAEVNLFSLYFAFYSEFAHNSSFCSKRAREKVLLVFDGVDTVSSIWLNGVKVGSTDNMFRRYVSSPGGTALRYFSALCLTYSVVFVQDFSVGDSLKDGENQLEVRFMSPVLYASQRYRAHSAYRVPPECPPDVQKGECHVNFIRKVSMSY